VDGNNPAKAPSAELVACLAEAADASAAEAPSAELVLTEWLGAIAGCPRAAYLMLTSGVLAQALAALEAAGGEKQVGGALVFKQAAGEGCCCGLPGTERLLPVHF